MLRKQQQVVGVEPGAYLSRLLWANSTGGARVPLSVAYRGDAVRLDGSDPLLLQAYGAYGAAFDPEFSSEREEVWDGRLRAAARHEHDPSSCLASCPTPPCPVPTFHLQASC